MAMLKRGSKGKDVKKIQERLEEVGFPPGKIDGIFGKATEIAVMSFQESEGLLVDGIVGPKTANILFKGKDLIAKPKKIPKEIKVKSENIIPKVTVNVVSKMFNTTGRSRTWNNISKYLPSVLRALKEQDLTDKKMVLMALSTIRAETGSFAPISEFKSRYNTSPGGHPFNLYDHRKSLGNKGKPDGDKFKGRGFIQLTGRYNYTHYSKKLGMGNGLVKNPDKANNPLVAARLLALFLKDKELRIKDALLRRSFREARKLVNGGSHGIDAFTKAYRKGEKFI